MTTDRRRWVFLGLVLAAYAWRVAGLDRQSLWRDEVDAIFFAVRNLNETLGMFLQAAQNGPLYFLGLRPWFTIAGTSEFVLRYPSVAAGTASVALIWQVGRRLVPGKAPVPDGVALLGALFLAFNPYQVWYGQEGKMYATVTFLSILATWFWLRGVGRGGWRPWLGYLMTVSIAMYTHLLMVLIIPLHLVWFFIVWPASHRHWRGYGVALAGLTLPYVPMVWWHWWLLTSPEKLSGFSFTPLDRVLQGLALNHARGFISSFDTIWLAPIFFLAVAGIVLGIGEIDDPDRGNENALSPGRRLSLLVTWLSLPIAFIYLISLRQPVFTERYVIWIGPAAVLLLALGVRVVARYSGRFAPVLLVMVTLYVLIFWTYANWQQKVLTIKYDLRDAVAYIHRRRDPATLLLLQIPHQEWSYRYYSSDFGPDPFTGSDARLGRWLGGPYTNYSEPDDQARAAVDTQMQTWTAGAGEVWVMLSEAEMWDSRRLMDDWLNHHGSIVEQVDFPGVQVRRYRLTGATQ